MDLVLDGLTPDQLIAVGYALKEDPPAPEGALLDDVTVDEAGVRHVEEEPPAIMPVLGLASLVATQEEKALPQVMPTLPADTPQAGPVPQLAPRLEVYSTGLGAPELDTAGTSWDAAIHSANKSKVKDGTWRIKRNSGAATPQPQVQQPAPAVTYQDVMLTITQNIATGRITPVAVSELLAEYGIDSTAELMNHETRWEEIRSHVVRLSSE